MWEIAERRDATTVALSRPQAALLQTIYDEFRANTAWPTMYQVDRVFRRRQRRAGASTADVLHGLPDGLLMQDSSRLRPGTQDQIVLTISGVARCSGSEADLDSFLRAVRWCAKQEMKREPDPGQTSVQVTMSQVRRAIPAALRADPGSLDRLFVLLSVHNWGKVQSSKPTDGTDWTLGLGPEVHRFAKVQSVEDFIDALVCWDEENRQRRLVPPTVPPPEIGDEPGTRSYINPRILDQLREVSNTAWDTTKLVALSEELEACMRSRHVFASHAVLRALLDHVPPLFRQASFAAVVSSHSWSRTDKNYLRTLNTFRNQADDALHRQISNLPDLLMLDDIPQGAAVNTLLRECVACLQRP